MRVSEKMIMVMALRRPGVLVVKDTTRILQRLFWRARTIPKGFEEGLESAYKGSTMALGEFRRG